MLIGRRGTRGQNLTIAISKWLGTLSATIFCRDSFLRVLGVICCILDIIYIVLVAWTNQHGGVLPGSFRDQIRGHKWSSEHSEEIELQARLVRDRFGDVNDQSEQS